MNADNLETANTTVDGGEYIETKSGIRYYPKAKLWLIRGRVVMFDNEVAQAYEKRLSDLAQILDQDTKQLPRVFDDSLCFQITGEEYREIRAQTYFTSVLRKRKTIGDLPFVFTELGAMRLGFSFRTEKAIQQSKNIVAQFVAIRQLLRASSNALVAVVRNPDEKQLTEIITKSLTDSMAVSAFLVSPPHPPSSANNQTVSISNAVNHGIIAVALHHQAYPFSRLEKSIIPEGGGDAIEAVDGDSKLSVTTKAELKLAIQEVIVEHDRGENADRDKVQSAITRIEQFLDRAEGVGKTMNRVVGFVTTAASWAKRVF